MTYDSPISWEQGLFLQPQHFQLSDQVHDNKLINYARILMPYLWGVNAMDVDLALLANNIFSLTSANLILADGAQLDLPSNAVLLTRSFTKELAEKDSLVVYLGVKLVQPNRSNVTEVDNLELDNVETRFICVKSGDEIDDLYYAGPKAKVKTLRYAVRIFWDTEISQVQNYSLLPIARINKVKSEIKLDDGFIPPCLKITANDNLKQLMSDFYNNLVGRAKQLEAYKHNWSAYDGDRKMQENLQLLQTLVRYLAQMRQMVSGDHTHPFYCYSMLVEFLAELSVFVMDINFIGEDVNGNVLVPTYQHDDLESTYSKSTLLIESILDKVLLSSNNIVQAEFTGDFYEAHLRDKFFDNKQFYVLFEAKNADALEALAKTINTQAKLCSYSNIGKSIEYAVPGAGLKALPAAPVGIPNVSHCLYYEIDAVSSEWLLADKEQRVGLYLGANESDIQISFAGTKD
jgi:type VI secretion system protein ImpJ